MGIISWIILGGIAGWIGSLFMGTNAAQGIGLNILVGIVGAMIGGFIFSFLGSDGVTGFNLPSLGVAVLGSIVFIWLLKVIRQ